MSFNHAHKALFILYQWPILLPLSYFWSLPTRGFLLYRYSTGCTFSQYTREKERVSTNWTVVDLALWPTKTLQAEIRKNRSILDSRDSLKNDIFPLLYVDCLHCCLFTYFLNNLLLSLKKSSSHILLLILHFYFTSTISPLHGFLFLLRNLLFFRSCYYIVTFFFPSPNSL